MFFDMFVVINNISFPNSHYHNTLFVIPIFQKYDSHYCNKTNNTVRYKT